MKKTIFLISIFTLSILSSCHKEDNSISSFNQNPNYINNKKTSDPSPTKDFRGIVKLKHSEWVDDGDGGLVKKRCFFDRGLCLTIPIGVSSRRVNSSFTDIIPKGFGTVKMNASTILSDGTANPTIYKGILTMEFNQLTALDNNTIPIIDKESIGKQVSKLFGFDNIDIIPKTYNVNYDTNPFGVVHLDFEATGKLKAKVIFQKINHNVILKSEKLKFVNENLQNSNNSVLADIFMENNQIKLILNAPISETPNQIEILNDFSVEKDITDYLRYNNIIISKGVYYIDYSENQYGNLSLSVKSID